MVYIHGVALAKKYNKKWAIAALISAVVILTVSGATYAHGVKNIVEQGNRNCYGKVASLHATEGGESGNGIKVAYSEQNHTAVPNLENNATFQEEVKAIQAYCKNNWAK